MPIQTQDRVREAAERLGYRGDPVARALASGRTGNVGLLGGSVEDGWEAGVAEGSAAGVAGGEGAKVGRRVEEDGEGVRGLGWGTPPSPAAAAAPDDEEE